MKLDKIFITLFTCFFITFTFTSCDNDEDNNNSFEAKATEYIGTYQIESIWWSGNSLDFDLDDKYRNELTSEIQNYPNYSIKNNITIVSFDKNTQKDIPCLRINANLPYPDFKNKDSKIVLSSIKYLPQNFSIKNTRELAAPFEISSHKLNVNDTTELFLSNISEINIENINKKELKVRVKCIMFDLSKGKQEENYLHYIFKKNDSITVLNQQGTTM